MSLGTACGDSVFCFVTDFCESSGAASGDPFVPLDFIASFLWAPPVATQFSVLSQTFVKVQAPPVATLLFHLISSHHFSGHRLWRHSFLLFGHRQWRPLSFHITASFLWGPSVATEFSCLSHSELYVRAPSVATLSHRIASHRLASHRFASLRIASQSFASLRIASLRFASHTFA